MAQQDTEIRYLNAPSIDTKKKKYCHRYLSEVSAPCGSGR